MIDIRKLKELVRLMVGNDLTELDLRDSEEQVTLRRHGVYKAPQGVSGPDAVPVAAPAGLGGGTASKAAEDSRVVSTDIAGEGLSRIETPMVGTFYSAANPDSAPFVTEGSTVEPETVVCLLEAMKIFNEIKAECSGTIEKVLVKNGDSVEFGQPLFLVRPS